MFFRKTPQFYRILKKVQTIDTMRGTKALYQLMTHQEMLLENLVEQTGGSKVEVLRRILDDWTEQNLIETDEVAVK